VTAPERHIAVVHSFHTSELAVRDNDPHWTEIHRVLAWRRSGNDRIYCHVACGVDMETTEIPVSLSSGEISGALCARCFGHLIRSAA
jgi:hypothetical protein